MPRSIEGLLWRAHDVLNTGKGDSQPPIDQRAGRTWFAIVVGILGSVVLALRALG